MYEFRPSYSQTEGITRAVDQQWSWHGEGGKWEVICSMAGASCRQGRDGTGVEVRVRPWRTFVLYSKIHGKLLKF